MIITRHCELNDIKHLKKVMVQWNQKLLINPIKKNNSNFQILEFNTKHLVNQITKHLFLFGKNNFIYLIEWDNLNYI